MASCVRCRREGEGGEADFGDYPAGDGCSVFLNGSSMNNDNNVSCDLGYVYDLSSSGGMSSAASEWDLVCPGGAWLHAAVGAAPMAGYLLGGAATGAMADRVGRRDAFAASAAALLAVGLAAAAAPNYPCFLLAK